MVFIVQIGIELPFYPKLFGCWNNIHFENQGCSQNFVSRDLSGGKPDFGQSSRTSFSENEDTFQRKSMTFWEKSLGNSNNSYTKMSSETTKFKDSGFKGDAVAPPPSLRPCQERPWILNLPLTTHSQKSLKFFRIIFEE